MTDKEKTESNVSENFGYKMEDVSIVELKKEDLEGATVIDGFPGVGLVGSITANYLINTLKLEQIGIMRSRHFPPLTVVHRGVPMSPVRIYAGQQVCKGDICDQIVVFVSEFSPQEKLIRPMASTMLDWVKKQKCARIISVEGFRSAEETEKEKEPDVYAIASTDSSRELITENKDTVPFEYGTVSGISGVLLNEGSRDGIDVISLLTASREGMPDAGAGARVVKAIDNMILQIDLDPEPLKKEARELEKYVQSMRAQAPKDMQASSTQSYIG